MVLARDNDIAVIGMAGRFPEADTLEAFWNNLITGRESIRSFPEARRAELAALLGAEPAGEYIKGGYLETISQFDPEFFNLSAEEARYMDPQHRLLLEMVEEALEDAGYSSEKLAGGNVGVFTGATRNVYGSHLDASVPMVLVNSLEAALAGRVAYTFNFCGPALNIDTACSSSLVALHYACQSLRNGECEYAVAGGISLNIFPPEKTFAESSPIWSPKEKVCAFDKDADGSVGGEGGAVLFLKKLSQALADGDNIHAVIKGSAINSDGRRSNGLSAPNQYAQAEVIERALKNADVGVESISYIETHGTGTRLGDPIEAKGIQLSLSKFTKNKQFISIGSLKTNIGHLNPAAGIASVVKVILAMKHGEIPPSLNYEEPSPEIDFINSPIYVNNTRTPWEIEGVKRAGVTSLGLIGTNAHLILEEAPASDCIRAIGDIKVPSECGPNIFTLSAKNPHSLSKMVDDFCTHLETRPAEPLADIAYTLNTGRNHYAERCALIASTREELIARLVAWTVRNCSADIAPDFAKCKTPAVISPVFIYTDLLTEDFAVEDLHREVVFIKHYQECLKKAGSADLPIRYFAFQYALTELLKAYGLKPKAVLGIGLGKHVAEVVKGKITLETGLELVKNSAPGKLSVDESKLKGILDKMLRDEQNTFVTIGLDSQIASKVAVHVQSNSAALALALDVSRMALYEGLALLYNAGLTLNWDVIYTGQHYRRVNLPVYAFNNRSYLVKARDFHLGSKAAGAQDEPTTAAAEAVFRKADFTQIYTVFQDAISPEINLQGDFEESGGDSLAVMQIAEMLKRDYHVSVPLDLFYTVAPMQRLIEEIVGRINKNVQEIQSNSVIQSTAEAPKTLYTQNTVASTDRLSHDPRFTKSEWEREKPEHILLTGVTGFLGAHLIKDLLCETKAQIHCLVRGNTEAEARERCYERLSFYYGSELEEYYDERIRVVQGDLLDAKLGLAGERYDTLASTIDSIIHSAADVRHVGNYANLAKANVLGTQYMLDFAKGGREKRFHHISTLAVAGYNSDGVLSEDILDIGQNFESNVYAESKYAAEKLIFEARKAGQIASIYRIGNLVGRHTDGVFQQNIETNIFYNVIKGLVLLGKISPFLGKENLELLPIDTCTKAVTELFLLKDFQGSTFHLTNPKGLTIFKMSEEINQLGGKIEVVDDDTFYNHCYAQVQQQGFVQEISWIFNALKGKNDADYRERVPMKFDHTFSFTIFERLGFVWPDIDLPFLEKLFDYCAEIGYINLK